MMVYVTEKVKNVCLLFMNDGEFINYVCDTYNNNICNNERFCFLKQNIYITEQLLKTFDYCYYYSRITNSHTNPCFYGLLLLIKLYLRVFLLSEFLIKTIDVVCTISFGSSFQVLIIWK